MRIIGLTNSLKCLYSKMTKIIAEIGWNHQGDISLAKEMIVAASENGADFVKFQTWFEKDLKPGEWDNDGRREIYKKAQLTFEQHFELFDFSKKNNVIFFTSLFNENYVDELAQISNEYIKIPSMEAHDFDLILKSADKFKNIFISTGATYKKELINLVNLLNTIKKSNIVIFHCVSSYPTKAENINLRRIHHLKKIFSNVGYSGHYPNIHDAVMSLPFGVSHIEKHFTIDNKLPGRDNLFSILPSQLKELKIFIEEYKKMSLDHGIEMQEVETQVFQNYRGRWKND